MPLRRGSDRASISANIRELHDANEGRKKKRPHDQIVAIAMEQSRRHPRKRAMGGGLGDMAEPPPAASEPYHPGGLLRSDVPGRTDRLPIQVDVDTHVIPADVVSGLGQGNTEAGAALMGEIFDITDPRPGPGADGDTTSILAAGGEYLIPPADVRRIGNGSMRKGHQAIDDFIRKIRRQTAKTLTRLPGPKK